MIYKVGTRVLVGKKEEAKGHIFCTMPRLCEIVFLTLGGEKLIVRNVESGVISKIKIADHIITEVE